jgi:hypothetical protein
VLPDDWASVDMFWRVRKMVGSVSKLVDWGEEEQKVSPQDSQFVEMW